MERFGKKVQQSHSHKKFIYCFLLCAIRYPFYSCLPKSKSKVLSVPFSHVKKLIYMFCVLNVLFSNLLKAFISEITAFLSPLMCRLLCWNEINLLVHKNILFRQMFHGLHRGVCGNGASHNPANTEYDVG